MKIYAIPVFALMISLLGFCVHKQSEIRKYEKIRHVLNDGRDSSKIAGIQSTSTLSRLYYLPPANWVELIKLNQ